MSFKTVLRRNTDLRQDSKRSSSPESPMRDSFAPIDSRIRVNSEPSRPRMPASLVKSHLPDIEPTHKKAFIGAYVNTSLLSGKNKAGGTYLRDKSPSFEESPVQANKVKKNNNSMEVYSSTPQRYKGLDISTDSVKKSLLHPGNFSPSPLKFKTQTNVGRSITPNKPFAYELSDITSKAKPRMYSGANSKVKRAEQKAKPEPLSTSVNASPLQHRLDATKCSLRKNGVVEAYAANSNQGIVRNYNEDRVSIILNVTQPSFTEYQGEWPNCSFFGVYDGHGGSRCADFLKDNLHKFVMGNKNFPANPTLALQEGFREAEAEFLSLAQRNKLNVDQSGSCAVVALILDNKCYIANVGDSRAVLSGYKGLDIMPLSRDHKPSDENEQERIFSNGGKLYQSPVGPQGKPKVYSEPQESSDPQFGPLRVLPGRLAVSRTFGDIEAKFEKFGGNPNVVVAEPEIRVVELNDHSDFLILASDGIFDRLSNEDVTKSVWDSMKHKCSNIHEQASQAAESVMMDALVRKTFDNITVVILAFAGFKAALTVPEEKKEAPINFYQSLEKPALGKKPTLPIKAKVNNLSSEMMESQGSEERAQTSPDESAGVIEKDTTNFSLESVHKARPQSITRQLIRAYKKSPVIVGPK